MERKAEKASYKLSRWRKWNNLGRGARAPGSVHRDGGQCKVKKLN